MKLVMTVCVTALFAFSAQVAQAQNFTYETKDNAPTMVGGMGMNGAPVMGGTWTGTSTVTWADGKKTIDKYTCVSTSQPSNSKIFDVHTICDAGNAEGTYFAVFGCQYLSKDMQSMGCVGGITGKTGKYAGMGGGITFTGRSGGGSGTGTWNKAGS